MHRIATFAGVSAIVVSAMMVRLDAKTLALFAQAVSRPIATFEVASIKRVPPGDTRQPGIQPLQPGGLFRAVGLTLREFVRMAYGDPTALLVSQIVGGPPWADSERFEIVAKVPDASSLPDPVPQLGAMLRALLAERFRLTTHMDTRQLPVFDLVWATPLRQRGPRLRLTTEPCVPITATRSAADATRLCGVKRIGPGVLSGTGMTMTFLAGILSQRPEIDRVVRDRTDLSGTFDVDLEYGTFSTSAETAGGVSLFAAMQEQLGLKLESTRGPVSVVVIDRAERPTED